MKRKKRSVHLKVRHFIWIFAAILLVFLTLVFFSYFTARVKVEEAMIERIKAQELTLARAGALSISEFLKEKKIELVLLSKIEPIKAGREKESREIMKETVEQVKEGPFKDIVRINQEGEALWVVNAFNDRRGEGVFLADRDYFLWAKTQKDPGEVFVSEPIISRGGVTEGKWIVVIAAPVFNQESFNGVIIINLLLEDLTKKFVSSLAFSSQVEFHIINQEGIIVVSSVSETGGEDFLECFQQQEGKEKEDCLNLVEKALSGGEDSFVSCCVFGGDKEETQWVSAFSPIKINGVVWSLWISVPYQEVLDLISPIAAIQAQTLIWGLMGLVVLLFFFIFGLRVAQKNGFIDGFRNGRG